MNLLVFSPYYPPHTGGLESHSDEFNHSLSREGVTITVFTPKLPLSSPSLETRYDNVRILRFPAIELIPNYPFPKFWKKEFWMLWKRLQEEKYSLVLSRTRFFFTSLMAWHYARKASIPWVHIEHGSDFARFNSPLKTLAGKLYDYTLGTFVLQKSDLNIANSKASADFAERLSRRTDCKVIYRGVEKDIVQSVAPHSFFQEHFPGKVVIGFVGRLIDGKGVFDLIEAFSQLNSPTSICAIIGDGPERARVAHEVQRRGLQSQFELTGALRQDQIRDYLARSLVFVMPSYEEALSIAVIEARAAGLPVVARTGNGIADLIEDGKQGFLAPDTDSFVGAVLALLQQPTLCDRMSQETLCGLERFDWSHCMDQHLKVYEWAMSVHAQRSGSIR